MKAMGRACILAAVSWSAAALAAAPPPAAQTTLALDAAHARMELRAYAMGLMPLDGQFDRFEGTLAIDPAQPSSCRIDLRIAVSSLQMGNADAGRDMLSPALLDAARFPRMSFTGNCQGDSVAGTLDMHGVSRPVTLDVTRHGDIYRAEGLIRRADWGVTGRPLMAGPQVRIRFEVRLPAFAAATPHQN